MGSCCLFALFTIFLLACTPQPEHIDSQGAPNQRNVDMIKNGNATGSHEVVAESVNYGPATGYSARPKEVGNYPGIVMIHEWWGLNDNIREMAQQLASHGYVVLAVDMFNGEVAHDANKARELTGNVRSNRESATANLKAAAAYLRNLDYVIDEKIASLGWCFGGQWSLQLALNEKLAATVIYYGQLETDASKLAVIDWPVLGIFGSKDTSIPVENVKQFEIALNEAGVENEIYIYEGVGHAFANPSGMNYAPEQTKDAWEKTIAFLDKYLKKS